MSSNSANADGAEPVDKTPAGRKQEAALPSGEVIEEYGIVDLNQAFPSEGKRWDPELGPEEEHVVVPFRVVERGFSSRKAARRRAETLETEKHGSYKAVTLSDLRGY